MAIRWGHDRHYPGDSWAPLRSPLSAHARLAETCARGEIDWAEGSGLARAMMDALSLPCWILGGFALDLHATLPPEGGRIRLGASLVGSPVKEDGRGDARVAAVAALSASRGHLPWRDLHWWGDGAGCFAFPAPADGRGQEPWRQAWLATTAALGGAADDGSPARHLRPLLSGR